ncbi:MAG: GGDEF domain-containing protein [Burkholderiaceae bacterium]|jgi:diguanylate cyclase|nr:GGDEF domain-containing protein [Burkholderiaceae bacterium]
MNKPPSLSEKSVAEIARGAFRLLGSRKQAPTPDAYRAAFYEVLGQQPPKDIPKGLPSRNKHVEMDIEENQKYVEAVAALERFAKQLSRFHDDIAAYGTRLLSAIQERDFKRYERTLRLMARTYLKPSVPSARPNDQAALQATADKLRELLIHTLSFSLTALLYDAPELANEATILGDALKVAQDEETFEDITRRLKQLSLTIELKCAGSVEQQKLLLRFFSLLLNNIGELLEDDNWIRGQIDIMQELIDGPVTPRILADAETNLKSVIYKQSLLKRSLNDARESIKQLIVSFVERLAFMTESTGNYHDRIKVLSNKVIKAGNAIELNDILENIMHETHAIQTDTLVSFNQMQNTRQRVNEAEERARELESRLEQVSELIREDKLTGGLNRQGMEDAFVREIAHADRNKTPLCVAFLDLDNFRTLNNTHGHSAGDNALIHVVRVARETLRSTDVIARYGGEEFVILFPETRLENAMGTMRRLQRELTRHFFLHNNERILITFSAGVAMRRDGESWDALTHRADMAMYDAKNAGKNQVFPAE